MAFINIKKLKEKSGLATVEAAIVLTLLMMFTFGVMEYGWMFFRIQQVTNAAQIGARAAILPDATNVGAQARIDSTMTDWGLGASGYTVTFSSDTTTLDVGQLISVEVSVNYANIDLLGMSLIPTPAVLQSSTTMAKEGPTF